MKQIVWSYTSSPTFNASSQSLFLPDYQPIWSNLMHLAPAVLSEAFLSSNICWFIVIAHWMLKVIELSSSVLSPSAALSGGTDSEGLVEFVSNPVFHVCLVLKLFKLVKYYIKWWYLDGEKGIVFAKIKLNV